MVLRYFVLSLVFLYVFTLFPRDIEGSFLSDVSDGISQQINAISQSDFLKRTQVKWGSAERKAKKVVSLVQDGKLGLEIQQFISKNLKSTIGVPITQLEDFLKFLDRSLLEICLLICWILSGVLLSKVFSGSSTLFAMCVSLLLHAIYGPVWSMMQFIITIGTFGYCVSLIANNLVLLTLTFSTLFVAHKFFGILRGAPEPTLSDINLRICNLQTRQIDLDSRLQNIEELLQKK
ncbi:uncharacterized protein [Antedon mediterranea]|uniref:uncharacterized protein n=1 Tax=Antedon mediterranea TaxID=105859 RepID=UPI003AF4CF17